MGFSGRCEAIKAPTTENDTASVGRVAIEGPSKARKISPRVRSLRRARIRLATASTTDSTHSDQASTVAPWVLLPPTTRSCSFAASVTTPTLQHHCLPNVTTTVTKSRGNELLRKPYTRSSQDPEILWKSAGSESQQLATFPRPICGDVGR